MNAQLDSFVVSTYYVERDDEEKTVNKRERYDLCGIEFKNPF